MPWSSRLPDQEFGVDVGGVHQVLARDEALVGQRPGGSPRRTAPRARWPTVVIACVIRWTASSSQASVRWTMYPTQEAPERVR